MRTALRLTEGRLGVPKKMIAWIVKAIVRIQLAAIRWSDSFGKKVKTIPMDIFA